MNYIDCISEENKPYATITKWANGAYGIIVRDNYRYVYRFIEYALNANNQPEHKYAPQEEQERSIIIAEGIVAWWLWKRKAASVNEIFKDYYQVSMLRYKEAHEKNLDSYYRDYEREFLLQYAIPNESAIFKVCQEKLFRYLAKEESEMLYDMYNRYRGYVYKKQNELRAELLTLDTFLQLYQNNAYTCVNLVREKYDIYSRRHQKMRIKPLRKEIYDMHLRAVYNGYWLISDDYDNIWDQLLKEIEDNLRSLTQKEDRERYIISHVLNPFRQFTDVIYVKEECNGIRREIAMMKEEMRALETDSVTFTEQKETERAMQSIMLEAGIMNLQDEILKIQENQHKLFNICQENAVDTSIDGNPCIETCLARYVDRMQYFGRILCSMCLSYFIQLMELQERCGIYLLGEIHYNDYVNSRYVGTMSYAERLLKKIEGEKEQPHKEGKVSKQHSKAPKQKMRLHLDEDSIRNCFINSFKGKGNGASDLDNTTPIIESMGTCLTCPKDVATLALLIYRSNKLMNDLQALSFDNWLEKFYELCGVPYTQYSPSTLEKGSKFMTFQTIFMCLNN